MRKFFPRKYQKRASSLVVTLLVIVVLSTIVVAFMQSMAVERLTAKSLKNIVQAELAAQAGYEAAVKQIETAIGTNSFFVTGQTNYASGFGPVLLIGRSDLTNSSQLMPLASSTIPITNFATTNWGGQLTNYYSTLAGADTVDVNTRNQLIQRTTDTNYFRAVWVPLTNSFGETNARYAYVILDEQARFNPGIHNGRGNTVNATNWFGGPSDVVLTNAAARILTSQEATNAVGLNDYLWTPETLGQAFAARTNYENVKHLLTFATNATYDVLPGTNRPKYNINILATNAAFYQTNFTNSVDVISGLIVTNLPNFSSRDPSLRGIVANERRYLNRLAANIVDYIDADSVPSYANGGEPAGRDLYPLVTAIGQRFRRTAYTSNSTTIENQCFVQVWNPYTTGISLTNTPVRFAMTNQMVLRFGTGVETPFEFDKTVTTNAVVRPNEFFVIEFPTHTQTWTTPVPATNSPYIGHYTGATLTANSADSEDATTWPTFQLFVGGNLVDMMRRPPVVGPGSTSSGLSMSGGKLFDDANNRYNCYFIPTQSSSPTWRSVGDPRANFLSTYDWVFVGDGSYGSGTRWKGRQATTAARYQEFVANWVNRDYVRLNPSMGTAPGNVNTTPSSVASTYNTNTDAAAAIAVLKNAPMTTIGELGNIFDPIQAADDLSAPSGGSPSSPYVAAGGRTLRIGQPEFTVSGANNWNTNGRRAIELLDLFTVNWTNAASGGWPVGVGKINPNTASPEVLMALLSGIRLQSDTGVSSAGLTNLGTIATNIVNNRPYNKLSDLYKTVTNFSTAANYTPAFSSLTGGGTTNLAALDRMREEGFAKLVQNLAVQSRTYRVIVIGETLDRGKVRSRSAMESIVNFQTNSAGSFYPVVQFQKFQQ